jgi:hypothetical protein
MSGTGQLVMTGPLIVAAPVAAAAGAITFASPCCLPLVPGYLAYVTGMSGAGAATGTAGQDAAAGTAESPEPGTAAVPAPRGRAVAGTALFVLGFSALFASYGAAFGGLGAPLLGGILPGHRRRQARHAHPGRPRPPPALHGLPADLTRPGGGAIPGASRRRQRPSLMIPR